MAEPTFDHERLDVYRLSIEYVAFSVQIARSLKSTLRRIVSMLTRLIQRTQAVSPASIEYEYEYRDAEYE